MTRVSTYGQAQILLQDVLRNENRVFDGQRKISSGDKSRDYQGLALDVPTLIGSKTLRTATQSYLHDNTEVERRLELYNLNLGGLRDIAQGLRDDILSAINGNTGVALRQKMDDYFDSAVSLLDTRDNSRYIFSGSRTDISPLQSGVNTPAGLAAITVDITANLDLVFANNGTKQKARIDNALTLEYGVLANDTADEMMEAFRRLFRFDDGTENFGFATGGPFTAPMSEDQRNFLFGEINRLNGVIDDVDEAQALNGVHQRTIEDTRGRLESDVVFISKFISDIEDADMGIAISRLQQDELALDASFRMLAMLSRVSLLDFI